MAAFGQPGIVTCLEDPDQVLSTMKYAAKAIEAYGRGEVENIYNRKLMIASTTGDANKWLELNEVEDEPLHLSQLDVLPRNFVHPTRDATAVITQIIAPQLKIQFQKQVIEATDGVSVGEIKAGPAKTFDRSLAKCKEYMNDYKIERSNERWVNFEQKFSNTFGRGPKYYSDFLFNIMDFARCSVVCETAANLLETKAALEKAFTVVAVKNSYNRNYKVKGSGYRDMKLLVKADFVDLELDAFTRTDKSPITFICEIQLIHKLWIENKKTTSLSYKIIRAGNLNLLFKDFSKYITQKFAKYTREEHLVAGRWSRELLNNPIEFVNHGLRNFLQRSINIDRKNVMSIIGEHFELLSSLSLGDNVDKEADLSGVYVWACENGSLATVREILTGGYRVSFEAKKQGVLAATEKGYNEILNTVLRIGLSKNVREAAASNLAERNRRAKEMRHNYESANRHSSDSYS